MISMDKHQLTEMMISTDRKKKKEKKTSLYHLFSFAVNIIFMLELSLTLIVQSSSSSTG